MINRVVIFSFLALSAAVSKGQQADSLRFRTKVWNYAYRFLNDSMDLAKPKVLLYPVIAYSPETSLELGFSGLYLYYAKGDYKRNRLSEVQLFSFATLNRQYGAWFDHFLYSDNDDWFFLGRLRFQRFPLYYYGVGIDTKKEDETVLDADYTLIKERILRKITKNFFVGLEIDYQRLYNVRFADEAEHPHGNLRGAYGSTNLGLGLGLVYDSRKNALNVRDGIFAELGYLHYDPAFGSRYQFNSVVTDLRYFKKIREKQVLAFQAVGIFQNGDVPFNQLALVGGESLMRGYYTGRFRDKNYTAFQAEYRWLPFKWSKRFGATVFTSIGSVAEEPSMLAEKRWMPAGGAGLRFLVFPKKDIFIRADIALTPEGRGFYLYTGEAF